MSKKTIANFSRFVIPALWWVCSACAPVNSDAGRQTDSADYSASQVIGRIRSPEVTESSGIAASRCQSDVFWTHNDSGDEAFIYAFNSAGESLGTWKVPNAENRDWEDIATRKDVSGKCYLYIGEIGDNKLIWKEHLIYRVEEPQIITAGRPETSKNDLATAPAEVLRYIYPDGDHDAETLMVHPKSGDIYVLTKQVSGPAGVYRLKPDFAPGGRQTAVKVAEISVPSVPNGLLTGGDISPDGRRVVVCDYRQAYEFILPEGSREFDDIWKTSPRSFEIGKRKGGESIGYSPDGSSVIATSEGRHPPIIQARRLK
jgi:hypothetical protein